MRYTTVIRQNRFWLAPILVIALLALSAASLQAAASQAGDPPRLEQRQVFNDDLRVRSGQTIEGDVTIYQGDIVVERDGAIRGNVVVYNGDVEIKEGGSVNGNITAFSGQVEIDGTVNGSITSLSGDVKLGGSAVVSGDISVVSGDIKQDRGAVVQGSVLRGPAINLNLPPMPGLPGMMDVQAPAPRTPSATEIFLNLVGHVLQALLLLGLAVGVSVGLIALRPAWVEETRSILVERTALAFAAGLIFNLFGLALIGLLWITICFRPPAILLGLLFAAINFAGLAAVGDEIGRKIENRLNVQWGQPWRAAGVVLPGSVIAFLWVLSGCFGFFAYLGALVLSSLGVGAILVKVLKLGEPQPTLTSALPVRSADVPAQAPVETAAEMSEAVEPPVEPAASAEPVTAEPVRIEPAVETRSAEVAAAAPAVDDFTKINGIGPVFDQRLKEAGILTFADLAARTPAEIAEIVKWSPARIERAEIIEQARALSS
jgi:predicted flap endonuclease-1-like 5' DNA nuclease/cytoskeletal protein CcmA (bactofilin family)